MATEWRWQLLNLLGPGGYPGFLLGDWLRLLRENRFSVSPAYLIRAASARCFGLGNSVVAQVEWHRFGAEVEATPVPPPIFILGHWRSGTTFLHPLLACDEWSYST